MGKRIYPPLPQTQREAPGQKFNVLWRIYNPCTLKDIDRWTPVPMPKFMSETRWLPATNLSNPEAILVREYWQAKKDCGCFEFKVIPIEKV